MRHSWRVGGEGNGTVSKQACSLTRRINHSRHHMNLYGWILLQKSAAQNTTPYPWSIVLWTDILPQIVITNGLKSMEKKLGFSMFYHFNLILLFPRRRAVIPLSL
jgi:hypothetical protein